MSTLREKLKMRANAPQPRVGNPVSAFLMIVCMLAGAWASGAAGQFEGENTPTLFFVGILVGVYLFIALNIAAQWEKAVVLRLGRFRGLAGPGLFWIIPIVDSVSAWVDHRVQLTSFSAERTLTRDTVPVNIDAVLFWVVWDAQKAALEVANYTDAIAWAAQTALRDIIGKTVLADILAGREKLDTELQHIIDERTSPWGITVQSVEIRDIIIPAELENAMSRQAQAERERQARVILGESEQQIAHSFLEAARIYSGDSTALHLRAMNMLFEGLKERGALVIVPSSAVDTMNLGGVSGLTALAQNTAAQASAARPLPAQDTSSQFEAGTK
jgi:regulator of protease activity HflC (stomatin/prohibitin superfamily)